MDGTENTTSVLKYGPDKQEVARSSTSLLLSEDEFRHFYISVDPRKPIQVGEVGKKPILKHKAEVPFHVNFVGFATGNGEDGVFEFCTFGKHLCLHQKSYSYFWVFCLFLFLFLFCFVLFFIFLFIFFAIMELLG